MIKIKNIHRDSIADKIGMEMGMYLVSIDGRDINDELDLKFFEYGKSLDVLISKENLKETYHIEKKEGEPLGIELSDFKIRRCSNKCSFCFIDQNPSDVRESLLLKDDDYRMSFLYGNYITLTNFSTEDFKRVIELSLNPLYISVHTTNTEIRKVLMRNRKAGNILKDIKSLIEGGINLHTQIVLIPGFNDREHLNETLEDLLSLFPGIQSIGIVPVGLTSYRSNLPEIKHPEPRWMGEIIEIVKPYQDEMKKKTGKIVVYLADEFYIKTGNSIPSVNHYDDFSQLENGIGMVRKFYEGLKELTIPELNGRVLLTTGKLAAEIIMDLADKFREANNETEVLSIKNRYFGESVEVAGLLGGWDLLGFLSVGESDTVILPPDIVNNDNLFIDGCSLKLLKENLPLDIIIAPYNIEDLSKLL